MPQKILIIEDDREIAHLVELHLKDAGYEAVPAYDGDTGLHFALSKSFDLIILDLLLPGLDGLEVCRRVRAAPVYTPILMLTSRSAEIDRVLGLEIGADDYLTKPFSIRELLARVKALLRREHAFHEGSGETKKVIRTGHLVIDPEKRSVALAQKTVTLTAKEFDLLLHFARHPGRVYTRSELLTLVWGYGYDGYEHTVNSHINRLRSKIEADPAHPRYILSVRGVGYKFSDTTDPDEGQHHV
ncbi:MAG TPA: response regulator transcription factor [Nitrospirota bacterium]|nr:response regulator transcription factor [Nitrospirota bacterium]